MTDRELLEMAAKAAGIDYRHVHDNQHGQCLWDGNKLIDWNPLTDAGRVGKIVSRKGGEMLVEFFSDELIGKTEYSTIPLGHWGPVPEFFVEEYEPRAKKRGWRVSERGMKMFRDLGWGYTAATEGKA